MYVCMYVYISLPADSRRLPRPGGGAQSRWKRHMDQSRRHLPTCRGERRGEHGGSPTPFARPLCQAPTPLCLPGRQLFTSLWRPNPIWWPRTRLPESQAMSSLPGIWSPAQGAVWQMSVHQKRTPESTALLLSGHCQDLPTFEGPDHSVSGRKPETWPGCSEPAACPSQMWREPTELHAQHRWPGRNYPAPIVRPAKDWPLGVLESLAHCCQGRKQATEPGSQIGRSDSPPKVGATWQSLVFLSGLHRWKCRHGAGHPEALDRSSLEVGVNRW